MGDSGQTLNIIRNHHGDFEFESSSAQIDSWRPWTNDLWSRIVSIILNQREASIFQKLKPGEDQSSFLDHPEFHSFPDGDLNCMISEPKSLSSEDFDKYLNVLDGAFEMGRLWIGVSKENASVNPCLIFSNVFDRLIGDEEIGGEDDIECLGRIEGGRKFLWHHPDADQWGRVETEIINLCKPLTLQVLVNGQLRE